MADSFSKELPVIPSVPKELEREPLVLNKRPIGWISDQISGVAEGKTPKWWWALFIPSVAITGVCFAMIVYLMSTGVGVWGLQIPVAWAWDITNFVFWIGIGHAGTLISAILFLLRQKWRTSINRAAEASGLAGGCCPCRTRTPSGRSSVRRCCGTCSPSRLTSPSRCCSGTWA